MQTATLPLVDPREISLLMIEDATGDAAAITRALLSGETYYNFKIQRRATLEQGLDYLGRHDVDAVLLDLGLPDAVSLTALHSVHSHYPHLPIVIISGYSDIERVHMALSKGAQEFLIKGECSGAAIRQSIYQAIARKKIAMDYERGDRL